MNLCHNCLSTFACCDKLLQSLRKLSANEKENIPWHLIPEIASPSPHQHQCSHCISHPLGGLVVNRRAPFHKECHLANAVVPSVTHIDSTVCCHYSVGTSKGSFQESSILVSHFSSPSKWLESLTSEDSVFRASEKCPIEECNPCWFPQFERNN